MKKLLLLLLFCIFEFACLLAFQEDKASTHTNVIGLVKPRSHNNTPAIMSKASSIKSESLPNSPILTSVEGRITCQIDACRVRVLLFPLNDIPEKRFRFYSKVITECHAELNTSSKREPSGQCMVYF